LHCARSIHINTDRKQLKQVLHFRFSFEPSFPKLTSLSFSPRRTTSCNVHYSGPILYDDERETWSKSKHSRTETPGYTRKNAQVVTSLLAQAVNKMYSHCLSQVVNRFGTTCWITRLVARLFWQVRYMLVDITRMLQPCVDNLVTSLLYHGCNKLVSTVL
jgi:hypothetical protein